ncbi:MAG TPA: putative monovalent cation/H+ antiporter subunit A [Devosiaceae bacterium]
MALVPVAPFLAALLAPWVKRFAHVFAGWLLALVPLSIFAALVRFIEPVAQGEVFRFHLNWIPAHAFDTISSGIDFSFYLDGLSLTFALLISGIGTIIVFYSGAYLRGHPQQGRFYSFILMFMGSMLGLVLADNVITLFVFWELTSITSFLLIGFDHMRQAARRAAIQALVVTGGGGLLMLAGLILMAGVAGDWNLSGILSRGAVVQESGLYLPILVLVLAGAFTKSAQVPFHFWLPNAMEAPTPVSAFLHSATMVKAGVYLLARLTPVLGGTPEWHVILGVFGGATLFWGALQALRHADLKQMLANTTLASLGLLVLLIGLGTEVGVMAAVVYLVAHSFYKAALFLVAGALDHETGTRDITELGGLRGAMPVTMLGAVMAAISMAGLPPAVGYIAKEEMYLGLTDGGAGQLVALLVVIAGNALMLVVGAVMAIKPFMGPLRPTPKHAHEGPLALWLGPLVLGALALAVGFVAEYAGETFFAPAASAILHAPQGDTLALVKSHVALKVNPLDPLFWLSVVTWGAGVALYLRLERIRNFLRRLAAGLGWTADTVFDAWMWGLVGLSDRVTRFWHHGRLELYLLVVFIMLAIAVNVPLLLIDGLPSFNEVPGLTFYEWSVVAIAVLGLAAVVFARPRLVAIVSLGIQGFAVALLFMLFGAPDLSFTQFMVETLSVVILALVMTRLHLDRRDARDFEDLLRDGGVALVCGLGITSLIVAVLNHPLDMRLTDFFDKTSVAIAHGHNIVNVILVDYRGLDTFGEISVVMTAGIAILALINIRTGGAQTGVGARKERDRKAAAKPAQEDGDAA